MNDSNANVSRRRIVLSGASLLALSGCGSLIGPQSAPSQMYVLAPELPARGDMRALPWQLVVSQPEASASLSTDRIALKRGDTFDYYANAQWTDAVPQLLQTQLVQAFEKAGAMGSVAKDVAGIHADYILQSEVRAFEARYDSADGAPTVIVDLTMKLLSAHSGAIVAAHDFRHETPASANAIPAAVTAFDAGVSAVLADIVQWIFEAAPRLERKSK